MRHEVLNCLSRFLVRRLAVAVLRVITKRALSASTDEGCGGRYSRSTRDRCR